MLEQYVAAARYSSLFTRIDFQASNEPKPYIGSLEEVLDELEEATRSSNQHPYLAKLALHPPRVIRAVVDYKINNPNTSNTYGVLDLLREAIKLSLNIYQQSPDAKEAISRFRQLASEATGNQLLQAKLYQPSDRRTWIASDPKLSQKTATQIAETANRSDILLVAIAHGGVAAGMDTYLRYCDLTRSTSSEFYVARFSLYHSNDKEPRLTQEEIQYLQAQAVKRQVVIFDEDSVYGNTLEKARMFFADRVFPDRHPIVLTNLGTG